MTLTFLLRQIANAATTTAGHIGEDRVFFAMQAARRLPAPASRAVGFLLAHVPGPAAAAASAWLLGDETKATSIVETAESARPSRLLGEIALNLGMADAASRIAEAVPDGQPLRSRILWANGHIDEAIAAVPDRRRGARLRSDRETLTFGWWPEANFHEAAPKLRSKQAVKYERARVGLDLSSSLHVLTNSLPHTRSGYAYRSHLVLTTLRDAGHSVTATTRPSYPVTIGRLASAEVETVDGIDYLRCIPTAPAPTSAQRLSRQAEWTAARAEECRADVLHTTTHYINGLVTGAAARALGRPWVYEVRGVLEESWAAAASTPAEREARRNSQRFALMRAKEIEVAKSAEAVVTLGETMREHLIAGGVAAESITLIPNSVSETIVAADVDRRPNEVRTERGLPSAGIWVGTAASIVSYEGLEDLVDAVIAARAAGTDLRLLIAGDGVALPSLRERAAVLGDNAVFTGRVSQADAIEYQLGLDVIVVPRKDEPVCRLVTPIKPIEAMGLGRPVVFSDLPALRELVPDSAGVAVSPESSAELAGVLAELASDDEARAKLGENGREHVLATRRWTDIGKRYSHIYSRLLEVGVQ